MRTAWIKSDELSSYNKMLIKIAIEIENRNEDSVELLKGIDGKLTKEMK